MLSLDLQMHLHMTKAELTWPMISFSIANASFMVPFGRFSDVYGAYLVYVGGLLWMMFFSLALGFSSNGLCLIILRGFQGLSISALLLSGVKLLCTLYKPGRRRNPVWALFGAF